MCEEFFRKRSCAASAEHHQRHFVELDPAHAAKPSFVRASRFPFISLPQTKDWVTGASAASCGPAPQLSEA